MAVDLSEQLQGLADTERAPWQTPSVIRFAVAEARAGDTVASADGSTDKS